MQYTSLIFLLIQCDKFIDEYFNKNLITTLNLVNYRNN